jgi:hypothetical protein
VHRRKYEEWLACIAGAVAVAVGLVDVRRGGAVVADVSDTVPVGIVLIRVGEAETGVDVVADVSPSSSSPAACGQESQASPRRSPSALAWSGFATAGQLSTGQLPAPVWKSLKPSPSLSVQGSTASFIPS